MAAIHRAERTVSFKIVYCGSPLCGKTTNVQYVHSCLQPSTRGDLISLSTTADRTLFFDFLAVESAAVHGYKTRFHLYTVPGQVTYKASFQMVLKQADGIIFVADSKVDRQRENLDAFAALEANLRLNGQSIDRIPTVLQYNKRDMPNVASVEYMEYLLNNRPNRFLSFEASATRGVNVLTTLNAVSQNVLHRFSKLMEQRQAPADENEEAGEAVGG